MMALPITGSIFGEPNGMCSSTIKAHRDYGERFESCTFLMNDKTVTSPIGLSGSEGFVPDDESDKPGGSEGNLSRRSVKYGRKRRIFLRSV
jgi:hypothetical protein